LAKDSEHRMVFDIRGRRKRVVQVVYAVLAVLMGLSLFFVTGGLSLDQLFGGGSTSSITNNFDDQAVAIQKKLKRNPTDPTLLLALTKTRISSGNAESTTTAAGQQTVTVTAQTEYQRAAAAWDKYLSTKPAKPNANVALLVAGSQLALAQSATTSTEAQQNAAAAAAAEAIYAKARPSVGSYGNLAYYSYAAFDFKGGDAAAKKAIALAPKAQRKQVKTSLDKIRKQATTFQAQLAAQQKAQKGQGKQELQNSPGGLLGGGGGGLAAP
jgi:hypothetical protein